MIKAGAQKPDIGTVDAFKKTLLEAKSITFVSAGASGVAFLAIVKKLGIADAIKTKTAASAKRSTRTSSAEPPKWRSCQSARFCRSKARRSGACSRPSANLRHHGRRRQRQRGGKRRRTSLHF